jgi:Kef-type K+ transport system membrane component KefB
MPHSPLLLQLVLILGTFACAGATRWLGVHPVFGAFLFGAAPPSSAGTCSPCSWSWRSSRRS